MNALKKITTEAKRLYNSGKAASWKSAVKKASADYRAGKKTRGKRIGGVKVKPKRRKVYHKGQSVKVRHIIAGVGSVAHHKAQYKKSLANEIARKAGRREIAIKKNQRKKITKEIAKLRRDYRLMC